jgi:hypothetical protein
MCRCTAIPRAAARCSSGSTWGYESLVGSAWALAHETATRAIRLMPSGLVGDLSASRSARATLGVACRSSCPGSRSRTPMQQSRPEPAAECYSR